MDGLARTGLVAWVAVAVTLNGTALLVPGMDVPGFAIEDGANDVRSEPEISGFISTAPADVRRVEVTDDDEALQFRIFLEADLEPSAFDVANTLSGFTVSYDLDVQTFFYLGVDGFRVEADVHARASSPSGGAVYMSFSSGYVCRAADTGGCLSQGKPVLLSADFAANALHIRVPKADLDTTQPLNPRRGLDVFDIYVSMSGYARYGVFASVRMTDRAPDSGAAGAYTLHHASLNRNVRLLVPGVGDSLPLKRGENLVDLNVTNHMDGRRIVRLMATAERSGEPVGLDVPAAVTVPAGQTRMVRMVIHVPESATYGSSFPLRLRGEAVAYVDDVAEIVLTARVLPTLTPQAPTLYLQARARTNEAPLSDVSCRSMEFVSRYPCVTSFMTALPQHAQTAQPNEFGLSQQDVYSRPVFRLWTNLDEPFGAPVALAKAGEIRLNLTVKHWRERAATEADAVLSYRLPRTESSAVLAEGRMDIGFTDDWRQVSMVLRPKPNAPTVLPRGTTFTLQVSIAADAVEPGPLPLVRGGESALRLPVVELPPELVAPPRSAFQLTPIDDPERFINPGETQLFRVGLLNQAPDVQQASIALDALPAGWTAHVLPGTRYGLQPGDTIMLTVRLTLSPETPEGASVRFNLTATDETGRLARQTFRATAVTTVDVADQSEHRDVDPEAQARLVQERPRDTPGFPWIAAALVPAAWAVRRRR